MLIMAGVCRMNPAADTSKAQKACRQNGLEYMDWIEIARSKKILPQHKIVVYGYSSAESEKVAKAFLHAGYSDISIYNQFITEWSSTIGMPMQFLERFTQLVYPQWVQTLVSGGTPPHYSNNKFVICHAHYRNRDAYLSGHIPGAIDMDTLARIAGYMEPTFSGRAEWKHLKSMASLQTPQLFLYGKFLFPNNADPFPGSAAGHIGAIRCAFIMMGAGVKDALGYPMAVFSHGLMPDMK